MFLHFRVRSMSTAADGKNKEELNHNGPARKKSGNKAHGLHIQQVCGTCEKKTDQLDKLTRQCAHVIGIGKRLFTEWQKWEEKRIWS